MKSSINGNELTVASLATPSSPSDTNALNELSPSTNYLLLETKSPIQSADKKKLQDLSIDLQQYLGGNAWLCRYEPSDTKPLLEEPFVQQVVSYAPHLKIKPSLKRGDSGDDDAGAAWTVDIVLHAGGDDSVADFSEENPAVDGGRP